MGSNAEYFLHKLLGEDFLESLAKGEIYKHGTKSTVSVEDIRAGLQIVPRTVMALLMRELAPMNVHENKRIPLFVSPDAYLNVTCHERDVFSGDIEQGGKLLNQFQLRSLPAVGLVIMSTFHLYDMENLINSPAQPAQPDLDQKIQKMIDERLALHDLISRVVDNKLAHKDAVHSMVLAKLTEELAKEKNKNEQIAEIRHIHEKSTPQSDPYFQGMTNGIELASTIANEKEPNFVEAPKRKGSPVKDFLQKRQAKKEFVVKMAKGETVSCDDCGKQIFDSKVFSSCICYGENFGSKIFLKKNENGISIRFSRDWSEENIQMLLETLRKRRG